MFILSYGVYLLRFALQEDQLVVVRDLFAAVRELTAPSLPKDCSDLQQRVVAALVQFEANVPVTEHKMALHQIVHLVDCVCQLGPVHSYWMFPFER